MDHAEAKELHKQQERKQDHRDAVAVGTIREQEQATGTRRIHPIWLGALGFALAIVALVRWMAIF